MLLFGCFQVKVRINVILFCETIAQAGDLGRSSVKRQVPRFHQETRPFHCVFAARPRSDRLLFPQDCWNS